MSRASLCRNNTALFVFSLSGTGDNSPAPQKFKLCFCASQLILDAQCQATRDAQIQEKKQIEVELAVEDKRLDTMMEVERRKALEMTDKIDEQRKEQRVR